MSIKRPTIERIGDDSVIMDATELVYGTLIRDEETLKNSVNEAMYNESLTSLKRDGVSAEEVAYYTDGVVEDIQDRMDGKGIRMNDIFNLAGER